MIYDDPDSLYVAERLGLPRINIVPRGSLRRATGGGRHGTARPAPRAHRNRQGPDPAALEGTIDRVEHLGDQTRLHLHARGEALVTLADVHTEHRAGEAIRIAPVAPMFFDAEGRRIRPGP